jgi:hypothetical protein
VTTFLLGFLATCMAVIAVGVLLMASRLGKVRRSLDDLANDIARTQARIESFEKQLNEYWRGVEMKVGRIHDTFESGRACRMGTTIVDVDVKMGHLNRKMEEILERMPRPGREEEPS